MEDRLTLSATLTGPDRPGITQALMTAIAGLGTEVLDLEQVVVRGQVTIAVLLGSLPADLDTLEDRLAGTCARLGYRLSIDEGVGDNPPPSASSPWEPTRTISNSRAGARSPASPTRGTRSMRSS